ncbi:PIG-L family deacetylase [Streptomyces sp. NPDC096132]|uniref:PIG-L family deacetylase n=1 Tax=Streptomyces sp. NPDC096132 TaxID=3366075 RepID=UPI00382E4F5F
MVADPDGEAFGLGGLLALLSGFGVPTAVLRFTQGESSTLHGRPGDLRIVRSGELTCATRELGRARGTGRLPGRSSRRRPVPRLAAEVTRLIGEQRPTHLLVFDTGGITGHRDHQRARAPRCSPPAERVSPSWRGPCPGAWRNS